MCSADVLGIGTGTGFGTASVATAGCDNNWNTWWVGTRTQWNVTKDFYMGLDVLYQKMRTASTSTGSLRPATQPVRGGGRGPFRVDDQDNWQFRFRVHRDFYP